jgi:sugar (pentulose or hexulose) kinase
LPYLPEAVAVTVRPTDTIEPVAEWVEPYRDLVARYRDLYTQLAARAGDRG